MIKHIAQILGILFCFCLNTSWAQDLSYRLAGVVTANDGDQVAIIENINGEQSLFRKDDSLGNGQILQIDPKSVTFKLGEKQYVINLTGTGLLADEAEQDNIESFVISRKFTKNTFQEMKKLNGSSDKKNEKDFSQQVNQLLHLPHQTLVLSVNHISVKTPYEALTTILEAIEKEEFPRLEIKGAGKIQEVYLVPEGKL